MLIQSTKSEVLSLELLAEAEIALQKQRVQLLEEQKKELDKQISQLYGEMNELRRKVFKLRGETHV